MSIELRLDQQDSSIEYLRTKLESISQALCLGNGSFVMDLERVVKNGNTTSRRAFFYEVGIWNLLKDAQANATYKAAIMKSNIQTKTTCFVFEEEQFETVTFASREWVEANFNNLSTSATWGNIQGDITSQQDLMNLLNGIITTFADLDDVDISNPSNGQLVRYNATTQKWENFNPTFISGNQQITLQGDIAGSGTTTINAIVQWLNGFNTYDQRYAQIGNLSLVAFSNNYNDLNNKPAFLSQFTNDINYDSRYYTKVEIDGLLQANTVLVQADTASLFPVSGNSQRIYIARNENNTTYYWNATINQYRKLGAFNSNFQVSLSGGKRFLKWDSGQTVPAAGKTAEEILLEGAVESIPPTVSLSRSSNLPEFNQTSVTNVLVFSRTINSLGATIVSATLEYFDGSVWTVLSTNTANGSFSHSLITVPFFTGSFQYRYTVLDSAGASSSMNHNINPRPYVAPTASITAALVTGSSPETNNTRERGNTSSNLSGTVTRNSPFVNITSYQLQVSVNGGAFINIGSSVSMAAAGGSVPSTPHIGLNTANTLTYRLAVTDVFTTNNYSFSISFSHILFFGECDVNAAITSTLIRSLQRRFASAGSPFTFNTGIVNRRFIVAMDNSRSLTQAIDTNNNVDLTSVFVQNNNTIDDASGTPYSAKTYVYTNAIPYNPSVTIRINYI